MPTHTHAIRTEVTNKHIVAAPFSRSLAAGISITFYYHTHTLHLAADVMLIHDCKQFGKCFLPFIFHHAHARPTHWIHLQFPDKERSFAPSTIHSRMRMGKKFFRFYLKVNKGERNFPKKSNTLERERVKKKINNVMTVAT